MARDVDDWEVLAQLGDMATAQRLFIGGPLLSWVGNMFSGPAQPTVFAPWFTEDGDAAAPQDASQLRAGPAQVEMVQNCTAPDAIE